MGVGEASRSAPGSRRWGALVVVASLPLVLGCGLTSRNPGGGGGQGSSSVGGSTTSGSGGAPASTTYSIPPSDVVPLNDTDPFDPTEQTRWFVAFAGHDKPWAWPIDDGGLRAPRSLHGSNDWVHGGVVPSPSWEYAAFHGGPVVDGLYASDIRCRFYVVPLTGTSPALQEVCFDKVGNAREAVALSWVDERSLLVAFSASDGGDLQWFHYDLDLGSIKFRVDGEDARFVVASPGAEWFAFTVQDDAESFYLQQRGELPLALPPIEGGPEHVAWEPNGRAMSYPGPDGAYHCFDLRGEPTEIEVPELGALVMAQAWGDSMLALVTRSDGEDPDDTATMLNWFDLETGDWSSFELESPLAAVQQLLWTQDAQSLFAVGYWVPEGQSVIHNPLFRIDAPADGFFAEDSPTIVPLGLGDFESVVGLSWLSDGSILTRSRVTFPDVNVRYGVVRWSPGAETGDYEILGEDSFDSARDFSVSPSGENLLIEGEVGDNVTGQFWMRDGQVLALPDVWPSGAVVWLPVATGFIMTRGSTLLWADLRNGVPDAWIDIEPE